MRARARVCVCVCGKATCAHIISCRKLNSVQILFISSNIVASSCANSHPRNRHFWPRQKRAFCPQWAPRKGAKGGTIYQQWYEAGYKSIFTVLANVQPECSGLESIGRRTVCDLSPAQRLALESPWLCYRHIVQLCQCPLISPGSLFASHRQSRQQELRTLHAEERRRHMYAEVHRSILSAKGLPQKQFT